ncbi:hypothetical protein CHS0354_020840 [Potamilus streckersoni]|uniref:Pathogen-related protein n=1 Tax=Potamilus streckersoni TaxID=2493646 RepID=A0AAE0VJB1_9BIVA|nr:hypothetical protein CHS0354_020840 [Potamilus streckersoni]
MSEEDECPVRAYMDDENIQWLHGKPDYSKVNLKYLKEKTKRHKAGSLEKLVENLVKTWEMESSHKAREEDWKSVENEVFTISTNGGCPMNLKDNITLGNYNILLADCPLYNAKDESNESSHKLFRSTFLDGFAWELLELFSGPPVVTFSWRHWGTWTGDHRGVQATGEVINMYGSCVVRVNENLKIQSIEVYYDPNPMMAKLTNFKMFE